MTAALEPSLDSFKCRRTLKADGEKYDYFSLKEALRMLASDRASAASRQT